MDSMTDIVRPTTTQHEELGRAARMRLPRPSLAAWEAPANRADPVDLLLGQAGTRDPSLIPVRHARMGVSPFTFFRGTALVMARDLAALPDTGLETQLCGDAHLSNFGLFASEDRRVVFDVNDFDETWRGPFEWDVKRLATSFVLAAADAGLPAEVGRAAALEAARSYRSTIEDYASMPIMRVWYDRMESSHVEAIISASTGKTGRRAVRDSVAKAETRDTWSVVRKLTRVVDGHRQFLDQPPLLTRIPLAGSTAEIVESTFAAYRASLNDSRRRLLDRFHIIDFAHKVVGVGSVGLYSWVALLEGIGPDDVLVLQLKEAQRSVIDRSDTEPGSPGGPSHAGQRVVEGQRLMQASGDVFLGWATTPLGGQYYGRQLRDMKWSPDPATFTASGLLAYARLTGTTLARAHARSGDPVPIAAYLGLSGKADRAFADFAVAYAEQATADYAGFVAAIRSGRLVSA
jgi:uncharacterized protein (DUF2252 family)